jgi:hypothetical protein
MASATYGIWNTKMYYTTHHVSWTANSAKHKTYPALEELLERHVLLEGLAVRHIHDHKPINILGVVGSNRPSNDSAPTCKALVRPEVDEGGEHC